MSYSPSVLTPQFDEPPHARQRRARRDWARRADDEAAARAACRDLARDLRLQFGVALTANLSWPQLVNTAVTLTATPQGSDATVLQYRFDAKTYDPATGSYTTVALRDYTADATYVWRPIVAQPHWLTVTAIDDHGTVVRSEELYYRIDEGTIAGVALNVVSNGNGTLTLQASRTGTAATVEYRFVANVPVDGTGPAHGVPTRYTAFTMLNYGSAATYVWEPSSAVLGKAVKLVVYARIAGSTANLQKTSLMVTVQL
jgi:type II secretory pathway pseudopilin PulG